jgi:hypothetical protein
MVDWWLVSLFCLVAFAAGFDPLQTTIAVKAGFKTSKRVGTIVFADDRKLYALPLARGKHCSTAEYSAQQQASNFFSGTIIIWYSLNGPVKRPTRLSVLNQTS